MTPLDRASGSGRTDKQMTADALRMEAYKARALASIGTISDAEDYALISNMWLADMTKKRIPDSVREPIVEALEEKRVKVAKRAGAA